MTGQDSSSSDPLVSFDLKQKNDYGSTRFDEVANVYLGVPPKMMRITGLSEGFCGQNRHVEQSLPAIGFRVIL
jgi:hypothetical protein